MGSSIRKFTLLGICLGTILLFSFYLLINAYLLKTTFVNFEDKSLLTDVQRVVNALHEEVKKLDDTIVDWAVWDDSALFMQDKAKDFVASNLNDRTLNSLGLAFILFIDNAGNAVVARSDAGNDVYADGITDDVQNLVRNTADLVNIWKIDDRVRGIARLGDGFVILASCPIYDSEGKGDRQGLLVMGRQFSSESLKKVADNIRIHFALQASDAPLPADIAQAKKQAYAVAGLGVATLCDIDRNRTCGLALLDDVTGRKALRLIVYGNKDIIHSGAAVIKRTTVILVVGGILLLGSIIFLVEKRVLRRILGLKSQISEINAQQAGIGDMPHVDASGNDEITALTDQINAFVDEINNYKNNLERLVLERTDSLNAEIRKKQLIQDELELAKQAAEQANRMKTDFLAKVTHEIRTPMNAIKGLNEYLIHTPLNTEQRECATIIQDSSNHLLAIVNDLLDLSRIEAGKLSLEHIDFNLPALVSDTAKILRPLAERKKLKLSVRFAGKTDVYVRGDPARLRQILFNLTHNAIKFTSLGEIRLAVTAAYEAGTDTYAVTLTVKDSGIGVSREQLGNIFLPFTQSDNSTSRQYGGTGLGLAICKQLMELMGGSIAVASRPGVGSEFTCRLRLEAGQASPAADKAATHGEGVRPLLGALKILVVDDNVTNLKVAEKMFSMLGQKPTFADSGPQALELLRTTRFDIVFLDIEMPGMNGFEVTRILRGGQDAPLNQRTHIVAMTAYTLDTIKQQCQREGMDGFLSKPIELDALSALLQPLSGDAVIGGAETDLAGETFFPASHSLAGVEPGVLDTKAGLARLGMDFALYNDVCAGFLEKFNAEKFEVVFIRHTPDLDELRIFVHTLKGIAQQLGAERMACFASALEADMAAGKTANLDEVLPALGREIRVLEEAISRFRRETGSRTT